MILAANKQVSKKTKNIDSKHYFTLGFAEEQNGQQVAIFKTTTELNLVDVDTKNIVLKSSKHHADDLDSGIVT